MNLAEQQKKETQIHLIPCIGTNALLAEEYL
jgi:hypothetical protein